MASPFKARPAPGPHSSLQAALKLSNADGRSHNETRSPAMGRHARLLVRTDALNLPESLSS